MKNKKVGLIVLIITILVMITTGIIYFRNMTKTNRSEAYIKIYIGRNVGMTALYVPESCYEINESGKVKYIENVDEEEFDILGKIKKSKLKELEEKVMNAHEVTFNPSHFMTDNDYSDNYYHIEVLNNRYRITNHDGEEIVNIIKENTK